MTTPIKTEEELFSHLTTNEGRGGSSLKTYHFTIEQLIEFFDEMDKELTRLNEKVQKFLEEIS